MSTIINGSSPSVTFSDSTTQTTAFTSTPSVTTLTTTNDASISGLTVGKGGGSVSGNTSVGFQSLQNNTTANNNTAVGYQAGYSQTTPAYGNTLIGYFAGYALTTGAANTFVGNGGVGNAITTGSYNAILGGYNGNQGGLDIRTASNYIVLSDGSGNPRGFFDNVGVFRTVTTTGFSGTAGTLATAGYNAKAGISGAFSGNVFNINWTGNPFLYIDSTNIGQLSTVSDYRLKENVVAQTDTALSRVMQLQPVQFNRKTVGIFAGSSDIEEGFIADQLQSVIPSAVYGAKDAVTPEGDIQPQSLNWSPLVSVLTKAIQELNAKVTAQAATIASLQAKVGV